MENGFIKQVSELKIVTVTKPRTYLQWINTEKGRDKYDCYERIENGFVKYVNTHNKLSVIMRGDNFFEELEEMYQIALLNNK